MASGDESTPRPPFGRPWTESERRGLADGYPSVPARCPADATPLRVITSPAAGGGETVQVSCPACEQAHTFARPAAQG